MTVLDWTGSVIGVVKELKLPEGVKPSPALVLGQSQGSQMIQDWQPLKPNIPRTTSTHRPTRKGHLVIETSNGKDLVESLKTIHRVADTAVHLSVLR